MNNTRNKIEKALSIQQKIEGKTLKTELLLRILPFMKRQSELSSLVRVKWYSYGKLSYQCHCFYYPKELLKNLVGLYENQEVKV